MYRKKSGQSQARVNDSVKNNGYYIFWTLNRQPNALFMLGRPLWKIYEGALEPASRAHLIFIASRSC